MGCFPSGGYDYDTLISGLTLNMAKSTCSTNTWLTNNNNYIFEFPSPGTTINKCISVCVFYGFPYAGLERGFFIFFSLRTYC